jgi:hypothetical protein
MIRSLITFFVILAAVSPARAFDVINEKINYADSKYLTLSAGLGFVGFAQTSGVRSDTGFGFRLAAGHQFTNYLESEIAYQFSIFDIVSPDPVAPANTLSAGAGMNEVALRVILSYPAVLLQPYLSGGIGGYNIYGVDQTALSFPMKLEFPVGVGLRAYTYKNRISFDAEFNYQFLLGTNQSPDTLALLKLNKVDFNAYSAMLTFTFHAL